MASNYIATNTLVPSTPNGSRSATVAMITSTVDGQQVKQETSALTESSSDLHIAVLSVDSSLQKV